MQDTQSPSAAVGPRVRAPEAWDAARTAYLDGESAQSVCDRFGLSLSAFRTHARLEGWRRTDLPEPGPDEPPDTDAPPPSRDEMMDMAWRMAARAIRRGRSGESQRWLAVHARLAEQNRADRRTEAAARVAEHKGAMQRIRAVGDVARRIRQEIDAPAVRPDQMHPMHPMHHDSGAPGDSGASAPDSPAPPLSRADRRRLAKLKRKR